MVHKVPSLRSGSVEEKHILALPDGTQYLVTLHRSVTSCTLYIGGYTSYCIECQVFYPESPISAYADVSIGNIPHVYYDSLCCINRPFQQGSSTRSLFLLLLSFVRNTFPHIKGISLNDESYKQCENGTSIDLAQMHYLQDGQTWYMSRFGAIMDKGDSERLHQAELQIKKDKLPWDVLTGCINTTFPISEKEMQELYETSGDVLVFFQILYRKIGAGKFCTFLSPWISTFMKRFFRFEFRTASFVIYLDNPKIQPHILYTVSDIPKKGGRYKRTIRNGLRSRRGFWI